MESTIPLIKKFFKGLIEHIKDIGVWKYLLQVLATALISFTMMALVYVNIMLFVWGYPVWGAVVTVITVIVLIVIPLMMWKRKK